MHLLDLTLATCAENVALDEALLDAAEAGELAGDVLRLWESPQHLVVVGRSSRVAEEVNSEACQARGIPILRRSSGGAAVVAGPGCLMYGLLMRYAGREHLRMLDALHRHVLGLVRAALLPLAAGIEHVGTCDLSLRGKKFSGNAVRCKRGHFLYHGTLLYDFDLPLIGRLLHDPPRQPDYRAGRAHADFTMNLRLSRAVLTQALCGSLGASQALVGWPDERTENLVRNRYGLDRWTFER